MSPNDFVTFCEQNRSNLEALCRRYADYEPLQGFSPAHLQAWLRQFSAQHRIAAVRLAKSVAYYGIDKITALMRPLKEAIDQQIAVEDVDPNSVFYVPLGRSGESGTDVVRRFRNANRLHHRQNQFVTLVDLPQVLYKVGKPLVVFMDDFVGSGKQATDAWEGSVSQVVPDYIPLYLAVVAAFKDGIRRIETKTPLHVLSVHTLGPRYQFLESAFRWLSNSEKTAIRTYCKRAGNCPMGFGDLGLLVSFAYGTPNNTISVIRGSERQTPWLGLLPPWEDLQ